MWWITIIVNLALVLALSMPLLHNYQLESYKVKFNLKGILLYFYILIIGVSSLVIQAIIVAFSTGLYLFAGYILGLIPILGLVAINIINEHKVKLKFTPRIIRQLVAIAIFGMSISMLIRYLSWIVFDDRILISSFDFIFLPITFLASILIVMPIEKVLYRKYIKIAKVALGRENLIKIGITGSYGKTTVKAMLHQMLSSKYNVVSTPNSFNTPMGIARSINLIDNDTEVFIAEMGARKIGDIKELCDIVAPSIGVITGIAPQHLESFKSIENIIKTKSELVDNLSSNGIAFYNADSKYFNNIFHQSMLASKVRCNAMYGNIHISELDISSSGSNFSLVVGSESVSCRTRLIGKHNLSNIILAAYVALHLGVSIDNIANSISRLQHQPHRMELINAMNGVTIIDDSYNCNTEGAKAAIDTLKYFQGKKIVVCQGIVEMGNMEDEANFNIGMQMAGVVDILFAVGKRGIIIAKGFLDAGGNPTKVIYVRSLKAAQQQFSEVLHRGDVLLIMNDLTDNYM